MLVLEQVLVLVQKLVGEARVLGRVRVVLLRHSPTLKSPEADEV